MIWKKCYGPNKVHYACYGTYSWTKKCFLKFNPFDTSFGTIMSLVMSRFNNLNWDPVFNRKKEMARVKVSLNN